MHALLLVRRAILGSAALALTVFPLAACSPASGATHGKTAGAPAKPGPLGMLPLPSGAKPWDTDGTRAMNASTFIQAYYTQSAWTYEEGLYARRKFESGFYRGWTNTDGSQQSIAIIRFGSDSGAKEELQGQANALYDDLPKAGRKVTDSADDAQGVVNPHLDSEGNATVELLAMAGKNEVIDVTEYTAATPDLPAAKAILLKQVKALKLQD